MESYATLWVFLLLGAPILVHYVTRFFGSSVDSSNRHPTVVSAAPEASKEAYEKFGIVFQSLATLTIGIWSVFLFMKFESTERRIQTDLARIDLGVQTSTRLTPTHELRIVDLGEVGNDGGHLFRVKFEYVCKNQSSKAVEVSYTIIHASHAEIPPLKSGGVIDLKNEQSQIQWKHILSQTHYYYPKWKKDLTVKTPDGDEIGFNRGGDATALLDLGDTSDGSADFLILAKPGAAIRIQAKIGFDRGTQDAEHWHASRIEILPDPDQ